MGQGGSSPRRSAAAPRNRQPFGSDRPLQGKALCRLHPRSEQLDRSPVRAHQADRVLDADRAPRSASCSTDLQPGRVRAASTRRAYSDCRSGPGGRQPRGRVGSIQHLPATRGSRRRRQRQAGGNGRTGSTYLAGETPRPRTATQPGRSVSLMGFTTCAPKTSSLLIRVPPITAVTEPVCERVRNVRCAAR
jgi:hypothetical protein